MMFSDRVADWQAKAEDAEQFQDVRMMYRHKIEGAMIALYAMGTAQGCELAEQMEQWLESNVTSTESISYSGELSDSTEQAV